MHLSTAVLLSALALNHAAQDSRQVVERLFEAYRALDADRLVALMADNIVFEDPTTRLKANGRAEMRSLADGIKATYQAVSIDVHSMLVSGNDVAAQVTISGTMTKADGTTRQIRVRGASFFHVRNGRIETWTDYFDARTFLEQSQ